MLTLDETYNRIKAVEREFGITLGLKAEGIGPGRSVPSIKWNADEPFPSASVIKIPILFTCLRLVDMGRVTLDQRLPVKADDQVAGSGVLRDLAPGLKPTLRDLLTLMIIVSDNTATNMVIDLVTAEEVNNDAKRIGCQGTTLAGKLMLPPEKRNAAQRAGAVSQTTPTDMMRYMDTLYQGQGLSPAMRDLAHHILFRQHYTDSLTRFLPWPKGDVQAPWQIAAKSGSIQGVRHQVGWLTANSRSFMFAILTKGSTDRRFFSENTGNLAVGRAFRIVFDHFVGGV